jgi:hypothetical protein
MFANSRLAPSSKALYGITQTLKKNPKIILE